MKNTVLLLIAILALSCDNSASAQAPDAVKETFKAMYPGENDPDWHLDAHGNYEANFKKKGEKYRADYAADGTWIETENSIKKKNLPKVIKDRIKVEYGDRKITEVERVEHATKGLFYDVEFKQKGKNMDVEFDAQGNIIN